MIPTALHAPKLETVRICAMRDLATGEYLHFGGKMMTPIAAWRWIGTPEQAAVLRSRSVLARSLTIIVPEPKERS